MIMSGGGQEARNNNSKNANIRNTTKGLVDLRPLHYSRTLTYLCLSAFICGFYFYFRSCALRN